jgi:hypothetical protein
MIVDEFGESNPVFRTLDIFPGFAEAAFRKLILVGHKLVTE